MRRLARQPGERNDRARPLSFTFDGRSIPAFEGDTIASALLASGRHVLSRSFKYHRPRGELCGCGQCANSLVLLDGAPGIRACAEPVRAGMRVEHQNAWPSLDLDVMRATDWLGGPFTPVGFYYKTFIRPRRFWPVYERALRRAAGLGRLRECQDEREWRTEYRRRHCDVLVIGGGVAGLSAALRAADMGAEVVLCDEDLEPGGRLLAEGGHERMRELAGRAARAGVEILSRGCALGYYDGLVPVWQGDTLHQVRARRHIVATGTVEQPLIFPNNDLPGVMLAQGARRLAALYALSPGANAVLACVGEEGLEAALALHAVGVRLVAVADLRADAADTPAGVRLTAAGVPLLAGMTVVGAGGRGGVERALLAAVDRDGLALDGGEQELACDLLAVSGGSAAAGGLLLQAGGRAGYEEASAGIRMQALAPAVLGAGAVVGHGEAEAAELSGMLAGGEAALALGFADQEHARGRCARERAQLEAWARPAPDASPPPWARARSGRGRAFVDLDEDVTVKDVEQAVREGFDSVELSKRYTTATMGPTQGRFSQLAAARVLAASRGIPLAAAGLTTSRPPSSTVPLGVLAGRPFEPAKRSSIHARHCELGASIRWAADWRRAYDYGDPESEALAVQTSAGLIDVSTLGKLIVRGPQAGELLDRLYPNRMSNLKVGRIRYGVLLSDAGRISDDGTVCRLDEDSFYVTSTSGGASAVEQWFSWWLADWRLDAHLTDVTQGVAAVNLAGPNAREILSGLTPLDCSNEAFSYLDARHADVAGIPCLLLRIGFVGEVGYEIHCAAAHGLSLWDAIIDAGRERGIRPFGLEPQRILRLQKQHIIVGQDTDSESTPYNAALSWIVKLDKEQDFIGRRALEHHAAREQQSVLVGFTLPAGTVPTEGAVVLEGERPAGQVTSARCSPKLGRVIGLAWAPSALAVDGAHITISDAGRTLQATVTTKPFYDPEGMVLRS
jgi:sarcosine oxidase subunit alpha